MRRREEGTVGASACGRAARAGKASEPAAVSARKRRRSRPAGGTSTLLPLPMRASEISSSVASVLEFGEDRSMVARAELPVDRTAARATGEGRAGQDVIEPPPDIPLPHVAPGRPPREERVVVRIERSADVDEPMGQDPLEELPFLGELPDAVGLALLGMDVLVGPRDVQIAAEDRRAA